MIKPCLQSGMKIDINRYNSIRHIWIDVPDGMFLNGVYFGMDGLAKTTVACNIALALG